MIMLIVQLHACTLSFNAQTQTLITIYNHVLFKLTIIVLYDHTLVNTQDNCTLQSQYC